MKEIANEGSCMKQKYLCVKDWTIDSSNYFKKGKSYEGKPYRNGKSAKIKGDVGMFVDFHEGSEYSNI